ncbi:MAG: squalene synthase [Nitrospirae bacterium RIFCSPLOWO2_01_FULL_62_17]|nr:MAG: squalene synthase [Nitrospirae bacterium RIFCSPLOWO2_01_FULL_62_17]
MLATITNPLKRSLLRDILKQVSRSFYLTLAVMPADVRDQIGLSYLFARAADTIADTDAIERAQRLQYLKQFRAQFAGEQINRVAIRGIQAALAPHQTDSAERVLLQRLEDCFQLYLDCTQDDRLRIRRLMGTLPNGMEMDLARFPGDTTADLKALQTLDELDQYTYYVAGCVGEFWTDMTCGHRPALAHWNVKEMSAIGVRFGKGLQLTNILKDLAKDLQRGRCYIPEALLKEAGLAPKDLLRADKNDAFRPVLRQLLTIAREHLDQGWLYTMAIPRLEIRLRLSCMWPILFAGETLRLIARSGDLLNPSVTLKISRGTVYRIMALTILTGACGYVGTAYWGWLRKQIV